MKQTTILLALVLCLYGCSEKEDAQSEISYLKIKTKVESRSVSDFVGNEVMKLWITKGSLTDAPYGGDTETTASYGENEWQLKDQIQLTEDPAYVYACYPSYGEMENGKYRIDNRGHDYLYAGGGNIATQTKPNVVLTMKHAMTCIGVNVKKGNYQGSGNFTALRVRKAAWSYDEWEGYHGYGYLDPATGDLEYNNEDRWDTWFNCEKQFEMKVNTDGWDDGSVPSVAPFPFLAYENAVQVHYTIDNRDYEFDLPANMRFEKGKKYIFDITMNQVDVISVRCVDWETSHIETGEIKIYPGGLKYQEKVSAGNLTVTIPDLGNIDGTVDWGDGNKETYQSGLAHTYAIAGIYNITITTWSEYPVASLSIANRNFINFRGMN